VTAEFDRVGCLAASSREAVLRLIACIADRGRSYIRVCGAQQARWVADRCETEFCHEEVFYAADEQGFLRAWGRWQPRRLAFRDRTLVEKADGWPESLLRALLAGWDCYGIVAGRELCAYCWAGPAVPPEAGIGMDIDAICGLHTSAGWRRQRMATELLSHATERILAAGRSPTYYVNCENKASRHVAESLGYLPFMTVCDVNLCLGG